jgi:uncharacterized protein YmfQ (DUF2313 family)
MPDLLSGFAQELARADTVAASLVDERDTRYTDELLEEHEQDLGIPDSCLELGATARERRAAVHAKFVAIGGQNKWYFIQAALGLGYTVTITEFTPAWARLARAGDPCGPQENIFHWRVNVTAKEDLDNPGSYVYFFDHPQELECLLNKLKPAHTVLIVRVQKYGFSNGFSNGFKAVPVGPLTGGFSMGFSNGFERRKGGGFDFGGFDDGFEKPK